MASETIAEGRLPTAFMMIDFKLSQIGSISLEGHAKQENVVSSFLGVIECLMFRL